MAKIEKSGQSLNQIKTSTNLVFNFVFLILAVMCVIPLLFVFSISISDEESLRVNGYQLIPQVFMCFCGMSARRSSVPLSCP